MTLNGFKNFAGTAAAVLFAATLMSADWAGAGAHNMMGPGAGRGPGMGMGPGGGMMGGRGMIDLNQDGLVAADEAAAFHDMRFEMLDADADEIVTKAEFTDPTAGMGMSFEQMQANMAARMGDEAAAQMMSRMQARLDAREARREARFAEIDANADGNVSRDEFMTAGETAYAASDLNGDGRVTVWEYRRRPRP